MGRSRHRLIAAGIASVWLASGLAADHRPAGQEGDSLVGRFLASDDTPVSSYTAIRRLTAANDRYNVTAWIEARTEWDRTQGFRYHILAEEGSAYVRGKVLRKTLERERDAHRKGASDRGALTPANYIFREPIDGEAGLVRIPIEPRRRDELLIAGELIVTAPDGDLVRVQGRLADNPSFWTRQVEIVRRYGRVNGVRMPVEVQSTANVRMAGASSFAMCYRYETINGAPVSPSGCDATNAAACETSCGAEPSRLSASTR